MPKFMCTQGHLHNEQWRADNCATCKRNDRRRLLRFVKSPAFQEMAQCLHHVAYPPKKNGKPSRTKPRAVRGNFIKAR